MKRFSKKLLKKGNTCGKTAWFVVVVVVVVVLDASVHRMSMSTTLEPKLCTCAESPVSNTPGDSGTPRALDDKELFIIEGSPGAQRPNGRSAKNARKTNE